MNHKRSVRCAAALAMFLALAACVVSAQAAPSSQHAVTEYRLPPDLMAKAEALYRIRLGQLIVGTALSFGILIALIWLRVGVRLRNVAERLSSRRFVQALIFCPLLLLTIALLELPLSIYAHTVSAEYGLSVQRWGSWWWDWTKGQLIDILVLTLLAWGGYALLRRTQRWWLWAWIASIPLMLTGVLAVPLIIDPLFNKFEPLQQAQPQLVKEIDKVVAHAGLNIPEQKMFEMKASEKVTTYNAYVTGIGPSRRVVVWDTTARGLPMDQTLSVFGHEMGHYVLNHIWKGLALGIPMTLLGLWLSDFLARSMLAKWGERWRIRDVKDWASLPVFLLVFTILSFVGAPIINGFSRHIEHQADVYGLEVTHGVVADPNQAATQSFQKMGEKGLSYPYPNKFLVFWFYTHPPISDRVRFMSEYRPWETGQPMQFVK